MKVTKEGIREEELHALEQRAIKRVHKTRRRMRVSGKSVFALMVALTKEKK